MEASAGGWAASRGSTAFPALLSASPFPAGCFPSGVFWQVQLFGFGRALDGSASQQAPDAGGGETGYGGAAAEQEEAAAPDGDSLVRSRPPSTSPRARPRCQARPQGEASPIGSAVGRRPAARSRSSVTAEPARRAPTMVINGRNCATNGSARAAAMAMAARTATPASAREGCLTARLPRRTANNHGADEHGRDQRRYVGRAEEFDALRDERCLASAPLSAGLATRGSRVQRSRARAPAP